MKENKVYVAGPMTWIPMFNFPAFDAASEDLRKRGIQVWSPAEMDDEKTREKAMASPDGAPESGSSNGETWGDFLTRDLKIVIDEVDAVVVLPGWNKSKGAKMETFAAFICGKPIYYYPTLKCVPFRNLVKAWVGVLIPKKVSFESKVDSRSRVRV